jgi:hypothetical protein
MKIFDAKLASRRDTLLTPVSSGPEVLTDTVRTFIVSPRGHHSHGMRCLDTPFPQAMPPREFQK